MLKFFEKPFGIELPFFYSIILVITFFVYNSTRDNIFSILTRPFSEFVFASLIVFGFLAPLFVFIELGLRSFLENIIQNLEIDINIDKIMMEKKFDLQAWNSFSSFGKVGQITKYREKQKADRDLEEMKKRNYDKALTIIREQDLKKMIYKMKIDYKSSSGESLVGNNAKKREKVIEQITSAARIEIDSLWNTYTKQDYDIRIEEFNLKIEKDNISNMQKLKLLEIKKKEEIKAQELEEQKIKKSKIISIKKLVIKAGYTFEFLMGEIDEVDKVAILNANSGVLGYQTTKKVYFNANMLTPNSSISHFESQLLNNKYKLEELLVNKEFEKRGKIINFVERINLNQFKTDFPILDNMNKTIGFELDNKIYLIQSFIENTTINDLIINLERNKKLLDEQKEFLICEEQERQKRQRENEIKEQIKRELIQKEKMARLKIEARKELFDEGFIDGLGNTRERIGPDVMDYVYKRDKGMCVFCKSSVDLEFDHIIPVSKGGSNTERNLQLLCRSCNRKKGAKFQ